MTSLRFAMDVKLPYLSGFRVKMVDKWFLDFGLWTVEESILKWNDFLKENQTVDMSSSSFFPFDVSEIPFVPQCLSNQDSDESDDVSCEFDKIEFPVNNMKLIASLSSPLLPGKL
ncbi:unnamed protein product [Lactuca virosa]|uniref:Uncharacterized protein n=1 Tax=Lactuca virosa TaxID=75947 RepID=A0AAU9M7V0_9ASTR|nr:unnamed protein product [Lactuca virosa]